MFHVLVPFSLIGLTMLFIHTSKMRFSVKEDYTNRALTVKLTEQNTRQYEIESPISIGTSLSRIVLLQKYCFVSWMDC